VNVTGELDAQTRQKSAAFAGRQKKMNEDQRRLAQRCSERNKSVTRSLNLWRRPRLPSIASSRPPDSRLLCGWQRQCWVYANAGHAGRVDRRALNDRHFRAGRFPGVVPVQESDRRSGVKAAFRSAVGLSGWSLHFGYQHRNTSSRSSFRTFVRVCSGKWAAMSLHHQQPGTGLRLTTVDRRLYECSADCFSLPPPALAEVRDELAVVPAM